MARKISGGLVGQPSVGAINVAPTAVMTAAPDQNITISPIGDAAVVMTNNVQLNTQNDLRFADADSSNWVAFQSPETVASNVTWTLPAIDGTVPGAGVSNQVLSTNGSGTLSWITPNVSLVDQTVSSSTHFVTLTTATSDSTITTLNRSSTKLTFQPSTGTLTLAGSVIDVKTENLQTGSYTLVLADQGKVISINSASAATVTVPPDSTADFPVGTVIKINRLGTGDVTLAAGAGVTVSKTGVLYPFEELYIRKRAANNWVTVDGMRLTASGGNSFSTFVSGYYTHTFTSGGNFTVN
jgi:hypothetical protein